MGKEFGESCDTKPSELLLAVRIHPFPYRNVSLSNFSLLSLLNIMSRVDNNSLC